METPEEFPEYRVMDVADLIPYARNAKIHTEKQILKLMKSIKEFKFMSPIIVSGDGTIVAGHGRVLAAQRLGMKRLPTINAEHLTDEQRRAYTMADNLIGEDAEWDRQLLKVELMELNDADFDISAIGVEDDFFNELLSMPAPEAANDDSLFTADDQLDAENKKKREKNKEATKTMDGYAEFSLVMQVQNRDQFLDVIKRVQTDHGFDTKEDAIMYLVVNYG